MTNRCVFTTARGPDPVIVATCGRLELHPVARVEDHLLKDTSGAGDALVGGFLAQMVQGKSVQARDLLSNWLYLCLAANNLTII